MLLTNKIRYKLEDFYLYRRSMFIYKQNKSFFAFILSILIIRMFFVNYYYIPTSSMNPNLMEGDIIIVNKLAYNIKLPFTDIYFKFNSPSRGDIVTFDYKGINMIKRVVAVGGDTIKLTKNKLHVNGVQLKLEKSFNEYVLNKSFEKQKNYTYQNIKETNDRGIQYDIVFASGFPREYLNKLITNTYEYTVPESKFFMLGDNRNLSQDSRFIGTIHQKDITTKATVVVFNYKEVWSFIKGELSGLRFFISLS